MRMAYSGAILFVLITPVYYVVAPTPTWRLVGTLTLGTTALLLIGYVVYVRIEVYRLRKYGKVAIGRIVTSTLKTGFYFEQWGVWSNRLDLQIDFVTDRGVQRTCTIRDYIMHMDAPDYRVRKEVPLRYSDRTKRVVLHPFVYTKPRATAVRHAKGIRP